MREPDTAGRLLTESLGKLSWFGIILVVAVVLAPQGATAEDGSTGIWKYLKLDLGTWITTGEGEWTIGFATALSPEEGAPVIAGSSILEFEHLTNPLITVRAEVQARHWLAFDAAASFGTSLSGRSTDTDLWQPPGGELIVASISKHHLGGDTTIFTTNAYLRVFPFMRESENFIDAFVGYLFYKDSLHMTDGVQVLNVAAPETVGPISGLNSTYDFTWKGLRLGARGETATPWGFKVKGETALIPWMTFDGNGFWNLRDLRFKQEAEGGIGVDALVSLCRQVTRSIGLEVGFEYISLHIDDGEDIKLFPGVQVIQSELKEVKSSRYGPFLRFNVTF